MDRTSRRLLRITLCLVILAALSVALRTHRNTVLSADFLPLHLGTRCLVHGCDPYSAAALNALSPQTRPILPEAPVYPPSALMVLAPLEPVPFRVAGMLFSAISAIAAAMAMGALVRRAFGAAGFVGLAALAISPALTDALQFGNPAMLAVSCATLAVLAPGWWPLLGVAVALKPQLAVGAAVFLLLRAETRAAGIKALGLAAGLLVFGLIAVAHAVGIDHWITDIVFNWQMANLPGHSTDPSALNDESYSFLNLQPLLSRMHLPLVLAWTGALACLAFVRRARPYTALALLTLATILPLYHREYDRVAVLLLVPALVELGRWRWFYAAACALWLTLDLLLQHTRFGLAPVTPMISLLLVGMLVLPDGRPARAAVTS